MECFKVAHLRANGADVVIVPLGSSFGQKSNVDQQKIISHLQYLAAKSGVTGVVIPVWDRGNGRLGFIAPLPWHAFFSRVSLRTVSAGLNEEIQF